MIHVQCPHCGKSLKAPDQLAGKAAPCPQCRQSVNVPPPRNLEDEIAAALLTDDPGSGTPLPKSTSPNPRSPTLPVGIDPLPVANDPGPLPGILPSIPTPPRPAARWARPSRSVASRRSQASHLYLCFLVCLVPLGFSLLSAHDDVEQRLERTLESLEQSNPEVMTKVEASSEDSLDGLLGLLPDGKIEGAHLSRQTWIHWVYALASATMFVVLILALFNSGNATPAQVLIIGCCTATFGILFLLCVQWMASVTQGMVLYGRSPLLILFYIVKFIGFSYRAAMDPEMGFWMSFLGYTFGVGFCEELTKTLPVMFHVRGEGALDWRGACMWGLASGVGFGVAEGILYSSSHYNGLATGGVYLVRFISCVALHAVWSAAAGIMVWRRREWLQGQWDWGDMITTLLWVLGVPMILHGLYDTLLKKEMNGWALVAALASFAWLVFLTEWTRSQEDAFEGVQAHGARF